MKIKIDGRVLLVKKRVRDVIELQRQTGWKLEEMDKKLKEADAYSLPITAFFALANAGFTPIWEDLLDRDPEEFEPVADAGDEREGLDASDPLSPPSDSDPGGDLLEAEETGDRSDLS